MILELIRRVIALVQAASQPPADWRDLSAVQRYFEALAAPLAALVVWVLSQPRPGPVVGEEVRLAVASEIEAQGLHEKLPPNVVQAIVEIVLWLLSLVAR